MNDINHFLNKYYEKLMPIDKKNYRSLINLSSNESQHIGYSYLFIEFLRTYDSTLVTKYPVFREAHNKAALYHSVEPEELILVPGSDFAINLLMNAMGVNSDGLITHDPNYIGYMHYASLKNISVKTVKIINQDILLNYKNHIVSITNPEGFFGSTMSLNTIIEIATICEAQNHVLIIDEAYIEFNDFDHCNLISQFANVIIVRSYSKGMGLASMRLGVVLSSHKIIDYLSRFASENCISDISLSYLIFLFSKVECVKEINNEICLLRDNLVEKIKTAFHYWSVYNTHANFITISTRSVSDAVDIEKSLLNNNIRARRFSEVEGFENCIRITVPAVDKEALLLDSLSKMHLT